MFSTKKRWYFKVLKNKALRGCSSYKNIYLCKKQIKMARDKFHYNVRRALEKDGWTITHDPLRIQAGEVKGEVDLGAEKIFAAEKDGKQIAVEIKSFISPSPVHDFEEGYGQFRLYRRILSKQELVRELYLAVPEFAYNSFFQRPLIQEIIQTEFINIVVFDHINDTIIQWIKW